MKVCLDKFWVCIALLSLLCVPAFAAEQDAAGAVEADYSDAAFEKYVDVDMLGEAWASQDAGLLTDAALLLLKGEKELFRSHRAFTAQQIFDKALTIAADTKDTATLARIEAAAQANGNDAFAKKAAATAKLSAQSRAIIPNNDVLSIKMRPNALICYTELANLIARIRNAGDTNAIEKIEKNLKVVPETKIMLEPEQIEALTKLAAESRAVMSKASDEDLGTSAALEKLAGDSRPYIPGGGRPPIGGPGQGGWGRPPIGGPGPGGWGRPPIGGPGPGGWGRPPIGGPGPGGWGRPPIGGPGPRPPFPPPRPYWQPMTQEQQLGTAIGGLIGTLLSN